MVIYISKFPITVKYLFIWKAELHRKIRRKREREERREGGRQRERQRFHLPKWLQWPALTQVDASSPELLLGLQVDIETQALGPSSHTFPGSVAGSWAGNCCPYGMLWSQAAALLVLSQQPSVYFPFY